MPGNGPLQNLVGRTPAIFEYPVQIVFAEQLAGTGIGLIELAGLLLKLTTVALTVTRDKIARHTLQADLTGFGKPVRSLG
jgi:hypothetical protein